VTVDWDRLEHVWLQSVIDAISVTATENSAERFYAGAFWLLYGDHRTIQPPAFGMNSVNSEPDIRWHPPDWRWSVIDTASERVAPLYRPLLELDVDDRTYEELWDEHINVLARVSRTVTDLVRSNQVEPGHIAFTSDFFVGVIDFAQGDAAVEYLKRSVDEQTLAHTRILE
jgi:hypothetical protein